MAGGWTQRAPNILKARWVLRSNGWPPRWPPRSSGRRNFWKKRGGTMGRKSVKVLLVLVAAVAGLVATVTIIGMFLPKEHSFTRSIQLNQSPEAVWTVIADFAAQPTWRLDAKSVERLRDLGGKPFWKITTTHGSSGYLLTEESAPSQRLVVASTNAEGAPYVTWRIELVPAGGGCRISIHETGDFGNPYSRFMVRFVLGQTKFVDDYLTYLARKFGETPALE
jgi:hypothetical protein